ncbi:MAG: HAMP domain-containing protein [Jatrophihabitans sp.]|nr:MAG: HAMP domain-containing protein [Jatrophihabitans sp.]
MTLPVTLPVTVPGTLPVTAAVAPAVPVGVERRRTARKDTVRRRLRRLVLGVVALMLMSLLVGLFALQIATGNVSKLAAGYGPASDAASDALTYMLDAETGIRGYQLSGDPADLQPYLRSEPKIIPTLDSIATLLHGVGYHDLDRALGSERAAAAQWLQTVVDPVVLGGRPAFSAARDALGIRLLDEFRRQNAVVLSTLRAERSSIRSDLQRFRDAMRIVVVVVTLVAVGVGSYLGVRIAASISGPLERLWDTTNGLRAGDLSARTEVSSGPVEVRDVAAEVDRLGEQVQAHNAAQLAAAALRDRVQALSESLHLGVDAGTLAQGLVMGLGAVFGADRVRLHTFDDNRAPGLTVEWHAPRLAGTAEDGDVDAAAMRALANRLWSGAGLIAIADLDVEQVPGAFARLAEQARERGTRAALLAAVGEGASAFGVLSLSFAGRPHAWTAVELSLVRQLCAELAQRLVQGHVMSRQQELITQLRELDEAKTALVSTVSHELRTPLTSIAGYLELVLDGEAGAVGDEARDMLTVVERNVVRLRTLIEDLLTQSRIEAGRLRVTVTRIDLREVVSDVIAALAPIADSREVALVADVPAAADLHVEGDLRQLEQALTNLVANAVKFTPEQGRVSVHGFVAEDRAVLEVSDTGIGIPAEELPRLFERFYRASNAASAEIPGTGLGLSIVQQIVQAHGGQLAVESTVGAGTTFRIRLPAVTPVPVG